MASRIQELLMGNSTIINYDEIIEKHPWVLERGHYCILSPDSDGLLCGLLMSHFLDWKIAGFYDGKVMVLNKNLKPKDCIFLDIEIHRPEIRSMGHHMLLANKNHKPEGWEEGFQHCIQPNLLRNYDKTKDFRLKYPLATIHMLIGILTQKINIDISDAAICPLFFTDGVFNVLFSYPENVLNWLKYLRADEEGNALKELFENEKYSVFSLMKDMDDFFRERDQITVQKERGDRLKISNTDSSPFNINKSENNTSYFIEEDAVKRVCDFLNLLSDKIGWGFKNQDWTCWDNLNFYQFTKRSFEKDGKKSITIPGFREFMEKNPLSWAITSGNNIEYTLEVPSKLTD